MGLFHHWFLGCCRLINPATPSVMDNPMMLSGLPGIPTVPGLDMGLVDLAKVNLPPLIQYPGLNPAFMIPSFPLLPTDRVGSGRMCIFGPMVINCLFHVTLCVNTYSDWDKS